MLQLIKKRMDPWWPGEGLDMRQYAAGVWGDNGPSWEGAERRAGVCVDFFVSAFFASREFMVSRGFMCIFKAGNMLQESGWCVGGFSFPWNGQDGQWVSFHFFKRLIHVPHLCTCVVCCIVWVMSRGFPLRSCTPYMGSTPALHTLHGFDPGLAHPT